MATASKRLEEAGLKVVERGLGVVPPPVPAVKVGKVAWTPDPQTLGTVEREVDTLMTRAVREALREAGGAAHRLRRRGLRLGLLWLTLLAGGAVYLHELLPIAQEICAADFFQLTAVMLVLTLSAGLTVFLFTS